MTIASPLTWLTLRRPGGVVWGVPWPRGTIDPGTHFALDADGASLPLQTWTTATWPDGSVKWTAHAAADVPAEAERIELRTGPGVAAPPRPVRVDTTDDLIVVDTGTARWELPRTGEVLVSAVRMNDRVVISGARLVSRWQDGPGDELNPLPREELAGVVDQAVVEQSGPVRAVVRLTGRHQRPEAPGASRAGAGPWLPFTVRLVFFTGEDTATMTHTFVYDGRPDRDFLAGLGLRVDVPLSDPLHDRHVRLAGPADTMARPGFLTEAVRGITGLRRDPGERFRAAQVAGESCGPVEEWAETVSRRLHLIPAWNDWTLEQGSADGFTLAKRTGPDRPWVAVPGSTRSMGYGYLGGVSGGAAIGLRDFWELHPTRLDVRDAAHDIGSVTAWMWSPSAPAMDLRFYHDGLGQDSYDEQLEGLEITYEDYEPGFGTAHGIARTHELVLRACSSTPSGEALADQAAALTDPPLLIAAPDRLRAAGVFGDWSPVDRSTIARAAIEDRLDFLAGFYAGQVEQRRWYGFWDYGDVMHTYDRDRHQWRYDVGGYAWDNSELSPDLWLWTQFLRSGDASLFRLAEAMTRHTGEVDVYHAGPWAGLGSRHNVQHWGCSAKQLRISTAAYRRIYYYLTADERTGDLLDELADAERTFTVIDPTRKVRPDTYTPDPHALSIGLGTDYGALLAAWLTQWERHGDVRARDKIVGTMSDIGALPHGFLTGEALLDLDTGRFDRTRDLIRVSHLSAVFGLVEMCSELISLTHGTELEQPGFEEAWLQYCRLFLASPEQQEKEVGHPLKGISLIQAHSRLTAWAARWTNDAGLADRAWREFRYDRGDQLNVNPMQRRDDWPTLRVSGPTVLHPVTEVPHIGTNGAAQYGLAAIQNLALIGECLPRDEENVGE